MSTDLSETPILLAPLTELERALMETFIAGRGFDRDAFARLPDRERTALLTEASTTVSVKLAEIEARSHYLHELHESHH